VPPEYGFEIRVWREGEQPLGAHDAMNDNREGRVEPIGENRHHLNIDITESAGVKGQGGEYLWTVALVQISPNYADLGEPYWAEPSHLRFEPLDSSGSSNENGGSTTSTSNGSGPTIK
jgi:hypothetical protein